MGVVVFEMDLTESRSSSDEKEYRIVTIGDLECLIVSTKNRAQKREEINLKAAAAMSVQVGSFADPVVAGKLECRFRFLHHIF